MQTRPGLRRPGIEGGINPDAQIPDDATPISKALHRQWGWDTIGQVLSQAGLSLVPKPAPVRTLAEYKARARRRVHREGEIQTRSDVAKCTEREARVWSATVAQAKAAELAGSISPRQFPFVDAYFAGSSAATLDDAVPEILALESAEQSADATTELALQTALAGIKAARDEAGVDAVFPLFGP